MDISSTIVPRSDQLNSEDLLDGERTFTVTDVAMTGAADQPLAITVAEWPESRPYKPNLTSRKILKHLWGPESDNWIGRRLTLYRDPEISFGKEKVGGLRIKAMSDIEHRVSISLAVTKGRKGANVIEPLPPLTPIEKLRAEYRTADPERQEAIKREVAALDAPKPADDTAADPA